MGRRFNGTTDNIDMGNQASLTPGMGPFSIGAWVNTEIADGAYHAIISKSVSPPDYGLVQYPNNNFAFFVEDATNFATLVSKTYPKIGAWYLVGGTRDTIRGELRIYVNGNFENARSDPTGNVNTGQVFKIGAAVPLPLQMMWQGTIAEAFYYNTALSSADWQRLYQLGPFGAFKVRRERLQGYWILDGRNSPEPDYSGNGLVGTVTGTTIGMTPAPSPTTGYFYKRPSLDARFQNPYIKGIPALQSEKAPYIKGVPLLQSVQFPYIKGNVAFGVSQIFVRGNALLQSASSAFIRGNVNFAMSAIYVKGNASLVRRPPLLNLGNTPPTATKEGLLSRTYISLASTKKEVV